MEFISFKSYNDFTRFKYTLQINQEFSITYEDNRTSYFIRMPNGYSDFHNLNGPAFVDNKLQYYVIYGDHLGINLSNEKIEKLKNQYFKKLTFQ